MKHLNGKRLIQSEHTNIVAVRKDKIESFLANGYEIISGGKEENDMALVGKPIEKEVVA